MRSCVLAAVLVLSVGHPAVAQTSLVQIYIVQHPETDNTAKDPAAIPLTEAGQQRAALLVPTFSTVKLTHLIASHTFRTFQTLEPLARAYSLPIAQYPQRGSIVEGAPVDDRLTRQAAIDPVSKALLALPAGSIAFVALNSDNIFAILNRLGVAQQPGCVEGQPCVPCLNNTCWPGGTPDRLWHLVIRAGQPGPVVFNELHYAAGWTPAPKLQH